MVEDAFAALKSMFEKRTVQGSGKEKKKRARESHADAVSTQDVVNGERKSKAQKRKKLKVKGPDHNEGVGNFGRTKIRTVSRREEDSGPVSSPERKKEKRNKKGSDRTRFSAQSQAATDERNEEAPSKKRKVEQKEQKQAKRGETSKFPKTSAVSQHADCHDDTEAAAPRPVFPFQTDESDHAETPFEAYEDVSRLLRSLAKCLGVKPEALRVYDPYFCGGTVKKHLASLGFPNVYNEMEDFYDFAERGGRGPGKYDVVVTNPPYSGNHVERLFRFCARHKETPAFLLLPHFFYTEAYFQPTLGDPALAHLLFFLCPGLGRRYRYKPPAWAAINKGAEEGIAPFPSFWYCIGGRHTKALLQHFRAANEPQADAEGEQSRLARFRHHVFVARTVGELPNELKSEFDLGKRRPNPRARKKLAKQRQQLSGGTPPPPPSSKRSAFWRQKAQQRRKHAAGPP